MLYAAAWYYLRMGQVEDDPRVDACRRWVALRDAQWWRRMRAVVIALAVLCSVAAALLIINYLLLSVLYPRQIPGLLPYRNGVVDFLIFWFTILLIPLCLLFGMHRARASAFPPELVLALDGASAYHLQTATQRNALFKTTLQLGGAAILLNAVYSGLRNAQFYNAAWYTLELDWQAWLAAAGYVALGLLFICGPVVCLLEWQQLLLVRVRPRLGLAWVQALPLGVWILTIIAKQSYLKQLVAEASFSLPRDMWLYILEPLGLLAGLLLAPRLWRWAAQSLAPHRWLKLSAVCAAGLLMPVLVYALSVPGRGSVGDRPGLYAMLPLATVCRGAFIGNKLIGNTHGSLEANEYAKPDICQPASLRLAPGLFIPLWLVPLYIFAYYAYSYWVLHRAGADPPPGYRGTWDDA